MSDPDCALAAFEPIALAEMDGVSLMNRVDTKYVFSQGDLSELLNGLASSYRVLDTNDVRQTDYATLYFDTPGRDCFRDHHMGKGIRHKFRISHYASTGLSFFEVKKKTNRGRTLKQRLPIDSIAPHLSAGSRELATACAGHPIELNAQLWTHFSRITLVGRGAPERVTIDTGLRFEDTGSRESMRGVAIAEVKQERNSRDSAVRRQLRARGVRPLRISKYCLGATLLTPTLKSNLFKPKLLTLRRYARDH